jgi:hypothetical protein
MSLDYGESLNILGILHSSTDDEIDQAYRDLMRVWHPDRFATDERLRRKAEEESKRINQAMEVVRAYRTSGASSSESRTTSQDSQTNSKRSGQREAASTTTSWSTRTATANASQSIHPVVAYQRKSVSLLRCAAGGCALFVGYRSIVIFEQSTFEGAFASLVIFAAIYLFIRDAFLLISKLPILSATPRGLYVFGIGMLPWEQVHELQSLKRARGFYLGVTRREFHVAPRGVVRKITYNLRNKLLATHVVVPFAGLTAHPSKVASAAKAFIARADTSQMHHTEGQNGSAFLFVLWCGQVACVFACVNFWLFTRHPNLTGCLGYFQLFAIFQLGALFIMRWQAVSLRGRIR